MERPTGKPRILLGDDHPIFLEGLSRLLAPRFDVVASVSDGSAVVDAASALAPDVTVLDLTMPRRNGLEVSRDLLRRDASARIILLTMHVDVYVAASAFRAGVKGYLVKEETVDRLEEAIHAAIEGRRSISPKLDRRLLETLLEERADASGALWLELTGRQKEVLTLLAEGLGLKEIAARLGISIKTVEFHKYSMMERLGARDSAGLVRSAVLLGLIPAGRVS